MKHSDGRVVFTFRNGVEVRSPLGSGKDIADGKGVHCEAESEGSRMSGRY